MQNLIHTRENYECTSVKAFIINIRLADSLVTRKQQKKLPEVHVKGDWQLAHRMMTTTQKLERATLANIYEYAATT